MTTRWRTVAIFALSVAAVILCVVLFGRREPSHADSVSVDASATRISDGRPAGRRPASEARPTVLLLVIDTLRSDALGCYGSPEELTPSLDRLAEEGTRFEAAHAASSWTPPSMASLVTGVWPAEHGVESGRATRGRIVGQPGISDSFVTLAEAFRAQGYRTIGVAANAHLRAEHGFAQGFDVYANLGFADGTTVLKWLRDHRDELDADGPRFVFVHLFDPHRPYLPHSPWFERLVAKRIEAHGESFLPTHPAKTVAEMNGLTNREVLEEPGLERGGQVLNALRAAYDSEVAFADSVVARVFEAFEVDDETLVVFTSDHGEEFRDHGELGHRQSLYAELVRVPLIIRWPDRVPAGAVVGQPVSLVDLYPTILELAGLPGSTRALAGRSLWRGDRFDPGEPRRLLASTFHQRRYIHSISEGHLRLILDEGDGHLELYDEAEDRNDSRDLAPSQGERASALRAELEELLEALRSRAVEPRQAPLTPELEEQLRRLGYLEG